MRFDWNHDDHGISDPQWEYVKSTILERKLTGFFMFQLEIPAELGTVPCALYGPEMGDEPIGDDQVTMGNRGDRGWGDRLLVGWPMREASYVQVIGMLIPGDVYKIFTVYGGPEAPQNPADPSCKDPDYSEAWWNDHALATGNKENN
jgi:hypothetical protein